MKKYTAHFSTFCIEMTGKQAQAIHYGTSTDVRETATQLIKRGSQLGSELIWRELERHGLVWHPRQTTSTADWQALLILAAEEIIEDNSELVL